MFSGTLFTLMVVSTCAMVLGLYSHKAVTVLGLIGFVVSLISMPYAVFSDWASSSGPLIHTREIEIKK